MTETTKQSPPETVPPASPLQTFKRWWDNIQVIVIALILALLLRVFVAEPRYIPSDSMAPTLAIRDRLVVEKLSYRFHPPEYGDIVVFDPPPQLQLQGYAKDQAFIKRIIGLPGQQIQVQSGQVFVDGQPLNEPYIAAAPDYRWGPQVVPPGDVFVMGDNRNNSNDSHVWGFLPQSNIIGRAWWRFWPFERFGRVTLDQAASNADLPPKLSNPKTSNNASS